MKKYFFILVISRNLGSPTPFLITSFLNKSSICLIKLRLSIGTLKITKKYKSTISLVTFKSDWFLVVFSEVDQIFEDEKLTTIIIFSFVDRNAHKV